MKKLIVIAFILSLSTPVYASKYDCYVAENPDGSVRTACYNTHAKDTLTEFLSDVGLLGLPLTKIDSSDFEASKEDRKYWKLEDGKIKVDQVKKQADIDAEIEKQAKIALLKEKLKVTEEEWEILKEK